MTPDENLTVRLARPDDVETLAAIEEEAAAWLRSRGIEPGNPPRPFRELFAASVAHGYTYLAERAGIAAGKITLQERDSLWDDQPGVALYVHGLTVRRSFAGQGIGRALLRWAETQARARGAGYLRLDCNADNPALRAYYERAGFTHRGDIALAPRVASRYEQVLSSSPATGAADGKASAGPAPAIRRFADIGAFYHHTEAFYAAHEAENNLPLGILTSRIALPASVEPDIYLATAERDGEIVAAAIRTPPFNLVLSLIPRADQLEPAIAALARDAHAVFGTMRGVLGPATEARNFAEQWVRIAGSAHRIGTRERIYQLDTVTPPSGVPGTMRRATAADRDLLVRWLDAFNREATPDGVHQDPTQWVEAALASSARDLFLWEDGGQPVTLVGHSGNTPHGARVGPVYTPPALRRRGYGSACTAAASQALLDAGRRFCFLFTDLANPTSNHIYQTIGYNPVCDVDEYRFDL